MKKIAVLLAIAVLTACTSINEIKSTKTYTPKTQREGAVNVAARATGLNRNRVGKTTVLTVPVGSIKAEGDTSANIMKSVRQALSSAGYNSDDSTFNSEDAGYLKAHIQKIEFGNFLFSTWGTIILELRLETRDGEVLWNKRIRSSINAVNNYDRTAIVAMNRLVKDMTKTFTSESFFTATQRVKRHNDFLRENISIESIKSSAALNLGK